MKRALWAAAAGMALLFASGPVARAQEKPAPKPMKLKVGDMAPDFSLLYSDGTKLQKVSLKDYRGKKNVALAFYVLAFTGG